MVPNILLGLHIEIRNPYRSDFLLSSSSTEASVSASLRPMESPILELIELLLAFRRQHPGCDFGLYSDFIYSRWRFRVKNGRYLWLLGYIWWVIRHQWWCVFTLCLHGFSLRFPSSSIWQWSRAPRTHGEHRPSFLVTLLIHLSELVQFHLILATLFIFSLGEGIPLRLRFPHVYHALIFLLGLHRWIFWNLMQHL